MSPCTLYHAALRHLHRVGDRDAAAARGIDAADRAAARRVRVRVLVAVTMTLRATATRLVAFGVHLHVLRGQHGIDGERTDRLKRRLLRECLAAAGLGADVRLRAEVCEEVADDLNDERDREGADVPSVAAETAWRPVRHAGSRATGSGTTTGQIRRVPLRRGPARSARDRMGLARTLSAAFDSNGSWIGQSAHWQTRPDGAGDCGVMGCAGGIGSGWVICRSAGWRCSVRR